MKRILFIAIVVILSSGFTFNTNTNKEVESSCPYLNKIHKQIDNELTGCPYLDGKISQQKNDDSAKSECPYLSGQKDECKEQSQCPYMRDHKEEIDNIKPAKHTKLKTS